MNFQIERLRQLAQRKNVTWQGGLTRIPAWVQDNEEKTPYRPWLAGWVSLKNRAIHVSDPMPREETNFELALSTLVGFACNKEIGGYRPGKVEVKDAALADYLRPLLLEADIAVERRDKLLTFEEAMSEILELNDDAPLVEGNLETKGVTVECMRSFAEAACRFYEAEPWEHLTDSDLVVVESPFVESAMRHFTVLGGGGLTYGIGFFDSVEQFEQLQGDPDPETLATGKHWFISFDPITAIPFGDADLWEDYNLPVATAQAYPTAACMMPGKAPRRPGPDVLAFFEGLMRTLAETTEEQMDSGRWSKTVSTRKGQMDFTLCLPDLCEKRSAKKARRKGGIPDLRVLERTQRDVQRILSQQDFENVEQMQEFMDAHIIGQEVPHREGTTALERAQDIVDEAFEARGRWRLQLARRALEVCPDCVDAYVLLAEQMGKPEKAYALYAKAMEVAEKVLGEEFFEENEGSFWGIIETRPYMRARMGLAQCLEQMGRTEEAIKHYYEMLRLNPGDNQGVRELLLTCLLETDADRKAERLLSDYDGDDVFARWRYARALLTFRKEGDSVKARKQLREAISVNKYVPAYILGQASMPALLPPHYGLGSEEEGMICASDLLGVWENTPGAMEWLESQTDR